MILEVELLLSGPTDFYVTDAVGEFIMGFRKWDKLSKVNYYPVLADLKSWVNLGLKFAPILDPEGDGIFSMKLERHYRIVGFFSGSHEDFIGMEWCDLRKEAALKVPAAMVQRVGMLRTDGNWRTRP